MIRLVVMFTLCAVACTNVDGADGGASSSSGTVASSSSATPSSSAAPSSSLTSSNTACTFNADCVSYERCECTEVDGCMCKVGARGTGRNGIDTCTDGNDCESSLCVEGPSSEYYCSGPCMSAMDCTGQLPRCIDVATLGRICARQP